MEKAAGNLKRVYTVADPLIAGHIETILTERGIHCFVRNRFLTGAAGEIPPLEAWPEVWVAAEDEAVSQRLIDEVVGPPDAPVGNDWQCPDCGETIEGQFAECWRCGGRPE
ncbi:hypothetical protein SPICUR_02310 [Spiribacter curvatus]|uniref:DUF2007 domain-containing protein n=1 Tax=Spiribacter curvatus TaxID=1335757 RepID=U5T2G9_9GAMM|nr:DUF2007 domain-containing protein [Spiribacter curvatus]AGY91476.1 hypothetical protein SPICUR_02310 [Spiribacter curvatus]